jgi:hypothetical protein
VAFKKYVIQPIARGNLLWFHVQTAFTAVRGQIFPRPKGANSETHTAGLKFSTSDDLDKLNKIKINKKYALNLICIKFCSII